jgi:hypothetical protein
MSKRAGEVTSVGGALPSAGGKRVCDIPERIDGRAHCLGISRGATVATARFAGYGWYAAGLWRAQADAEVWNVRTCDDRFHEFADEAAAVAFFLFYVQDIANGRYEDVARVPPPSAISRHGFS